MKIKDLCSYAPKSKIKAGEAVDNAEYMFFTSSADESKRYADFQFDGEAIIMGTGGNATLHYYSGKFSVSTDCLVILPGPQIKCKYLYYFFKSHMHILEAGFKGAGLKHTNKKYIEEIELTRFPDLTVQENIIYQLDMITNNIENLNKELELYDLLVKARFIEMFIAPDSISEWPCCTISDLCKDMRTGPFGSALHHDEFVDSGVFVLGIDNAVENKFSYNRMRYITEEKYQQLKRYTVYPGDVIITIMGTVGRSAVIPADIPTAINTKHLACITPNVEMVNAQFLACVIQMHPDIRMQLQKQCKGAIMDGLNLKIIKRLSFCVPPVNLQNQFVEFYTQVDKSKSEVQESLDKTQQLFDSLMQEYFG